VERLVQEADLTAAQRAYAEAREEADRCARVCARWTEAHGIGVWREGHPLDREKLRSLRQWRQIEAERAERVYKVLARGLSDG
jgi:hypothetical protein